MGVAQSTPTINDSIFSTSTSDSNQGESNGNDESVEITLADGTYTGEATGYREGLQVSVNVEDGLITQVNVTDHNEVNSKFYAEPIETIPSAIIEAQTTQVDTVSGATFTSIGIINAVNDALSDALVSGTLPDAQALPENTGRHADKGSRFKLRP